MRGIKWSRVFFATIIFTALIVVAFLVGTKYQVKLNNPAYNNKMVSPPMAPINSISTPTLINSTGQIKNLTGNINQYSNQSFGISFEYPKDQVTLREEGNRVMLLHKMGYLFDVKKISTSETVDSWWTKESKNYIRSIKTATAFKGVPVYYLKHDDIMQVPMDAYLVQKNGYILMISFGVAPDLKADYENDTTLYNQANEQYVRDDKPIVDAVMNSLTF